MPNLMKLKELVNSNFRSLTGFIKAASSGKFIEGRDNVGMYELPNSRKNNNLLDTYEMYGFGDIFSIALAQEIKRQKNTENSVLIRGPLNTDLVVDTWLAVKYFLENGTDFHIVDGGAVGDFRNKDGKDKWEYMIKAKILGVKNDKEQTVLRVNGKDYMTSIDGPLKDNKYFSLSIASDPHIILPYILSHMNNFCFSTYDIVKGEYQSPRETNFDVHLNGPNNHFLIKDLLELGAAIKEYCIEQAKK